MKNFEKSLAYQKILIIRPNSITFIISSIIAIIKYQIKLFLYFTHISFLLSIGKVNISITNKYNYI